MCYHPQKSSKRVGDRALAAGLRRPSGAAAGPKRNGAPRWRVRKWWLAAASGAVPAPRLGPRRLQARRRRRGRSPPAPPALAHLGGLPAHPHALADEPPRRRKNFGYWTLGSAKGEEGSIPLQPDMKNVSGIYCIYNIYYL